MSIVELQDVNPDRPSNFRCEGPRDIAASFAGPISVHVQVDRFVGSLKRYLLEPLFPTNRNGAVQGPRLQTALRVYKHRHCSLNPAPEGCTCAQASFSETVHAPFYIYTWLSPRKTTNALVASDQALPAGTSVLVCGTQ
jgi:hypothetical protein